jgi:putative membrane protein
MLQHLIITFVVPPVFLLAMPAWLFRLMIGHGRFQRFFKFMSRPLPAAIFYNLLVILTHWSVTVRLSVTNGPLHYLLHLLMFASALLAWTPVCAPAHEYRCSRPAAMIYLFALSVIPTIPGGWLANAEGVVYPVYDRDLRLWGVSVTEDQQMAGVTMKVLGGFYLWALITVIFFKWMNSDKAPSGSESTGSGSSRYRGKLVSVPDVDEFVMAQGPARPPSDQAGSGADGSGPPSGRDRPA